MTTLNNHSRLEDPARLQAIESSGLADGNRDPAFDRLTELAARMLHVPTCLMCIVLPDRQVFVSRHDDDGVEQPSETPIAFSYCQHVVASGEVLRVSDAREHPLLRDNPAIQQYGAIAYLGYPLRDADGNRLGSVCVIDRRPREWTEHDLRLLRAFTDLVAAEVQARAMASADVEGEAASYFAAVVHELRTPMTSVAGLASTLTGHWSDLSEERRLEFVQLIDDQARRLNQLVDDLLLQSQLAAGRLVARREPVRVSAVVAEVARQFPEVDIRFDRDLDTQALVDRMQLEQMLVNLVSNAVKYGAPPIEVDIRDAGDGRVLVSVADHGTGVPVKHRPRLFERFARAEQHRSQQGSGLGLWIVRQISRANDGDCRYRQSSAGATFDLELAAATP